MEPASGLLPTHHSLDRRVSAQLSFAVLPYYAVQLRHGPAGYASRREASAIASSAAFLVR